MVHNMDPVSKESGSPGSLRAARVLRDLLHEPVTGAGGALTSSGTDVEIVYGRRTVALAPVWAGPGWPTDVDRVRRSREWHDAGANAVPVLVGHRFSEAVRRDLNAAGIAWADEAGRASIGAPGLVLWLGDRARPRTSRESAVDVEVRWSPAVGLVTEALLEPLAGREEPAGRALPKIADLAAETGVSGPFVSRTLRAFDRQGWTRKEGGERGTGTVRRLVDPAGLLSEWAQWYAAARPEPLRAHGLMRDGDAWLGTVARAWPPGLWALTGGLALDGRAPFLTATPVIELYLAEDLCIDRDQRADSLSAVGLREVDSGARVHVYPASRPALSLMARNPWWKPDRPEVGSVRLYGDLLASGAVRGDEAAEHLRQTRIGF